MARNYTRTVQDMERYYYGAGTNMGFGYSGSELLKADATSKHNRWYLPSDLRTRFGLS